MRARKSGPLDPVVEPSARRTPSHSGRDPRSCVASSDSCDSKLAVYTARVLRKLLALLRVQGHGELLAPGTQAPAFDLTDHLDRRVRLSDFAGRTVVLWFYPKADTPG